MQNEQCCAIILAAGDGKRMKASCPKAMCKVLFKPMISWVVDSCIGSGLEKACVITGDGGEQIEEILPKNFITVKQHERKGTGHAVMMAKEYIQNNKQSNFIVLCADAPFVDSEIINESYKLHKSSNSAVTLITAELQNPFGYGRIVRDGEKVKAIAEQKDGTPEQLQIKEINSGSYWFKGEFLLEVLELITCNNASGEYYLTDAVFHAVKQGKKVTAYKCKSNDAVLGANDRKSLLKLNETAGQKVLDLLMDMGVNFYCTDGVVISPDAKIGADTTIGSGTLIKGKTVIGSGTVIEGGCIIEDSIIGDNCLIQSSLIENAVVGNNVRIGPNAHLRPKTVIGDYVKVGNFVEVKNSVIGKKSSIAHLTYIGDTDVGENVNMGCGCAVANFDGVNKYRSSVGDFAFLGCHTSLVSPVKIGKGAYTGAGSVITKDVPNNALAISRPEQRIIAEWAEKWRKRNNWQQYYDKKNGKPQVKE